MHFETTKSLYKINQTENTNKTEENDLLLNAPKKNKTSLFIKKVKTINNNIKKENNKENQFHNSNEHLITDTRNTQMNLLLYNSSKTFNIFPQKKSNSSKKKIILKKESKINNSINFNFNFNSKKSINTREELFKTEIKNKIINKPYLLNDTKKSDFSTTNTTLVKNRTNINENQEKENALLIPKEDLIFEEIKNYKCFKYFTKESLLRTSVPFIYINMNMNTTKNLQPKKHKSNNNNFNRNPFQINFNNNIKQFIEYDDLFLSKKKQIYFSKEKEKEILDNVYRTPSGKDMYEKISNIKRKKEKKKLKNYQLNFLKIMKHNITDKYYEDLKDKFDEIRHIAGGKYKNNYKFIKEVEKNEEKVIKNINKTYENFMKFSTKRKFRNFFSKPGTSKLELPQIKFEKIINNNSFSLIKDKIHKNRKSDYTSLSENKSMNRTSIKYKKKSFFNINKNKNILMTSPKTFTKFNYLGNQT